MKRKKFIAAVIFMTTTPFLTFSKSIKSLVNRNKGFKIDAGVGRLHGHINLKGVNANVLDVKVSGSDTEGGIAIFEQTSISQGKGTPLHIHHSQDEIFYVTEGSYKFRVGDDLYDLTKGDSIFLPRKVPHAWTQVSAKGIMTVTLQPAGKLENFFVSLAALDHEPTPEEVKKLFSENEMQIVGPPLEIS